MLANWVKETTATVGAGAIALGGAPAGYIPFAAAFPNGGLVRYAVEDGSNREIGVGTLAGSTLTRSAVLETLVGGVYTRNGAAMALSGAATVSVAAASHAFLPAPALSWTAGQMVIDAFLAKNVANVSAVADRLYAVPYLLPSQARLSALAIRQVVTAATVGSKARVGIYLPATTGFPGLLLAETATDILVSTTGYNKQASLSASVTLPIGFYWIALLTDSNAVIAGVDTNTYNHPYGPPTGSAYPSRSARYNRTAGWSVMPSDLTGVAVDSTDGYGESPRIYGVHA